MKRFTLVAVSLALSGVALAATPKGDIARGKQIAETVCVACHTADGNSGLSIYPRVAAQHAVYLHAQTVAIKEGKRTTGLSATMVPMVQGLSDQDIWDVATYFSHQQAKPGETDPNKNVALGKKVYRGGIADKKVPACMSCHGPNGAGMPDTYPRIGGQHADYLVEQMTAFRSGQRSHNMMDPIANRLNDEEIAAVANYLQGLE
ncbi:cytochrome c [Neisseriaceae bacterium CLB008]|nr:cytochrome c [Neisseriaceae bacterium]